MTDSLVHTKDYCVYPGEYNPLPETEALLNELERSGAISLAGLPLNMDEFEDCFQIEMVVPGVQREEIIIKVQDNILFVRIVHKTYDDIQKKKFQIHEFESGFFERHLLLPENADPEFIVAEYRQGILKLYVPKSKEPSKNINSRIVVY
jgi:HSP20 family protein